MDIPAINKKFHCIVDWDNHQLAAVISSYLTEDGTYFPIFQFPSVTAAEDSENDIIDENHLSRTRADEFRVFTINAIRRLGGCENLILAGLSSEQRSYLDFLDEFNVIEISDVRDVNFCLSPFIEGDRKKIYCRSYDLLHGLFTAHITKSLLIIDENAEPLSRIDKKGKGLVVIEDDQKTSSILAINYAFSIDSSVEIVAPLDSGEENDIRNLINEWQAGDDTCLYDLKNRIAQRIGQIEFKDYEFATFFTHGLPYTVLIQNIIPCSYVHLLYRADFFIINNLIFEYLKENGTAIIFSPEEFMNEETTDLIKLLESNNYLIKKLIGKDATVENIHNCIRYYPYDIFHICSHGGEIEGFEAEEEFTDSGGQTHKVEYDEVLGFAPGPETGLIAVHHKVFPRKFDGYVWKSSALKSKKYPHYVFSDMFNSISIKDKKNEVVRKRKDVIQGSCSIKCWFSNYQAMFSILADHSSPFVFNNTCWSANEISDPFLTAGVRSYICTLWRVENAVAVEVAKMFYNNLFYGTILDSFFKAIKITKGTLSQDIYIYYGLHFSTLKSQGSLEKNKLNTFKSLMRQYHRWREMLSERKGKRNEELIKEIIKWIKYEIFSNFNWKDYLNRRQSSKSQ